MKYLAKLALWMLKSAKYSDETTKNMVLTEAVKHLFNAISAEDILKENPDGTLNFEDKTLPVSYRKDLREQANLLPNLMLWKVLMKDIQYQLNKKMYLESQITQDMLWGKLITWLWDVLNTRIRSLQK